MKKLNGKYAAVISVLLIAGLVGCATGTRGRLPTVQNPTAGELRKNWHDYDVFFRPNIAFVYKLKDDQKIILDDRWVKITTEDRMAKSQIWDMAWVKEIIGQNDRKFGYLVQRTADNANVRIIDENTVRLYYHYVRTSGGP